MVWRGGSELGRKRVENRYEDCVGSDWLCRSSNVSARIITTKNKEVSRWCHKGKEIRRENRRGRNVIKIECFSILKRLS
jgi:hypothetical protein